MTRVSVVHVAPSLGIGGTEKSVETLARSLDGDTFDGTVWCLDELGVRGERLREEGHGLDLRVGDVGELADGLAADEPDVVHVHGGFSRGDRVAMAADEAGVPAVVKSTHFGMLRDQPERLPYDAYLFVSRMILHRYLTLSRTPLDAGGWPRRHLLLYNPVDLDRVSVGGETLRDDLDVPSDVPLLGKIGRSAPEKWGQATLRGFERLAELDDNVHLLLVNTPAKIRRKLDGMGLEDRVHYAEDVPLGELGRFYDAVDVLAHSSAIGECCPYVVLEAMAHRVPVVVNSQPMRDNGQIELVEHGVTGYVANAPDAYARAIREILTDGDLAAEMGATARERVEETFAAGGIADRLERVYADLLVRSGARERSELGREPLDYEGERAAMREFAGEYDRRLETYYDGGSLGYDLELASWRAVERAPLGRWRLYDLLRKGHLAGKEFLPAKLG